MYYYKYTVAGELYGKSTEPLSGNNVCMCMDDLNLDLYIHTAIYIDPKTNYLVSYQTREAPSNKLYAVIDQMQNELNDLKAAQNDLMKEATGSKEEGA